MNGPVINTLDIETAPIESWVWSTWKQNVGLNQIKRDWTVLSVAWKTLGKGKVYYEDVSEQEDYYDDYELMAKIWKLLDESDIIIAQNGVRFDDRKIKARLVQLGFPPPRPYRIIDTMLAARSIAAFTSNKLEWLAAILTDEKKEKHNSFPGFELWRECMAGNHKAWKVMKKYNLQDIPTCEKVYLKLRPWIVGHPNVAMYYDDEKTRCPRCASTHLVLQAEPQYTQSGQYARYRCGNCQGFARGRYTQNSLAKRKASVTC